MHVITVKETIKDLFLLLTLLAGGAATCSFAQPGTLDPSFGTGGRLTTPIGNFGDGGNAVAVQNDGKIVVGGYTQNSFTTADFAVVRYLENGNPDSTFGSNGIVTTPVELRSKGNALVIQNDGKILLAGASDWHLNLVRYNGDGSLDTSFGSGGKVITDIEGYYSERCEAVAIRDDGKILAGGYAKHNSNDGSYFLLVRYNADGSPDSTFAADGNVIGSEGEAYAMVIQPDGNMVLGGRMNASFALERYTADGIPDTAFGSNGTVITPIANGSEGRSVLLQPDGKLVLAGTALTSFNQFDFTLVRYTDYGTPDTTFGQGGIVTAAIGAYSQGSAAGMQSDGKILLAGYARDSLDRLHFAVARYTPDGNFDNAFGTGGKTITPFGSSHSSSNALAIQDNGRIVLAGYVYDSNNVDIALARYLYDGSTEISEAPFHACVSTPYPNPCTDAFTIRLDRSLQNGELNVYTTDGRLVAHLHTISGQEIHVPRNGLPPGRYYFRLVEHNTVIATDNVIISDN
jgi:uncharacterized delta-60 repeat protein